MKTQTKVLVGIIKTPLDLFHFVLDNFFLRFWINKQLNTQKHQYPVARKRII